MSEKTRPTKCTKCGSKVHAKWCSGAPEKNGRVGSLITDDGSYGFVCKEAGEHWHYYCRECDYAEH